MLKFVLIAAVIIATVIFLLIRKKKNEEPDNLAITLNIEVSEPQDQIKNFKPNKKQKYETQKKHH